MSATEHEGEGELHQAPWVYFVTYAACLGFLALLMAAKGLTFAAAAIVWFTLVSIPIQTNLAKRQFMLVFLWLLAAGAGYFALPYGLTAISWLAQQVLGAMLYVLSLVFG